MKRLLMITCTAVVALTGCLKDSTIITNGFNSSSSVVEIPGSGLENFAGASVLTAGVTDYIKGSFTVNFASKALLSTDLRVIVGPDTAAKSAYNAANGTTYEQMPDSCFTLVVDTVLIKAGKAVSDSSVQVLIDPTKVDPSKSYMLALSIKDAQGQKISGNFGTVYYHTIGNPLAGAYQWDFTRYNNNTGTGAKSSASFVGGSVSLLPDDPTTVEATSGYYTGTARYVITFSNNSGTLSNLGVSLNAKDVANVFIANGISVTQNPVIVNADFNNLDFSFQYVVFNGSAYRWLVDRYYK